MDEPYDISRYPQFGVTVDLVVLSIRGGELMVLVIERGREPYRGRLALPGGFVHRGPKHAPESLDEAAARELSEETGIGLGKVPYLGQLGAYGDPQRDPVRGNIVTVAYLVVGAGMALPQAGGDAAAAEWLPVSQVFEGPKLAFDHSVIVDDAVRSVRERIQYTTLALAFCGPRFGIQDLRRVYEIVWGLPADHLDAGNFHHRMMGMRTLLKESSSQKRPRILDSLGLGNESKEKAGGVSMSSSSSRRGRRAKLYEPATVIRRRGYLTPLEHPILTPVKPS